MALQIIDGFEQYGDATDIARSWIVSNTSFVSITTGRLGGSSKALRINGTATTVKKFFPAAQTVVIGFAFRPIQIQGNDFLAIRNVGVVNVQMELTGQGHIFISRGTTNILGNDVVRIQENIWNYIELKLLVSNTVGTLEIWINGVSVASATGLDTRSGGSDESDSFDFRGTGTITDTDFDDVYMLDTTGTDNNDQLGDVAVETIFPDVDGDTNDFTRSAGLNNFENVDDGSTPDDDSTYNHSQTVTHQDLYGFAALTQNISTVYGVVASMHIRKEDAGYREIRVIARNNVTTVEGADDVLVEGYLYRNSMFENNPDGGGNWTEATVNTAQFGIDLHF